MSCLADFMTEIHFGCEKPEHANAPNAYRSMFFTIDRCATKTASNEDGSLGRFDRALDKFLTIVPGYPQNQH